MGKEHEIRKVVLNPFVRMVKRLGRVPIFLKKSLGKLLLSLLMPFYLACDQQKREICVIFSVGWSGGAMVLGKLPVPGRPTQLDYSRARAYYTCSRCEWGLFGHFYAPAYSKNSGRALSVTPVRPVRPSVRLSVHTSHFRVRAITPKPCGMYS